MKNFMSAAEMRNHTDKVIDSDVELELEKLYELMYDSKHYGINVPDLSVGAVKYLKSKDYKIKHMCDQREGESYFVISWR